MSDVTEHYQIRRPSTFLSLIPTTSSSYPQRLSSPQSITSPKLNAEAQSPPATATETAKVETVKATEAIPVPETTAEEIALSLQTKHRRSSSLASDESGSKPRFLKLGPVHWGEGDGTGDWSEMSVAE